MTAPTFWLTDHRHPLVLCFKPCPVGSQHTHPQNIKSHVVWMTVCHHDWLKGSGRVGVTSYLLNRIGRSRQGRRGERQAEDWCLCGDTPICVGSPLPAGCGLTPSTSPSFEMYWEQEASPSSGPWSTGSWPKNQRHSHHLLPKGSAGRGHLCTCTHGAICDLCLGARGIWTTPQGPRVVYSSAGLRWGAAQV